MYIQFGWFVFATPDDLVLYRGLKKIYDCMSIDTDGEWLVIKSKRFEAELLQGSPDAVWNYRESISDKKRFYAVLNSEDSSINFTSDHHKLDISHRMTKNYFIELFHRIPEHVILKYNSTIGTE